MKKIFGLIIIAALSLVAVSPALANSDDVKWVAACLIDNKNEKQSVEVLSSYCVCMNGKMGTDEKLSITEWEKTHKTEREECDKTAGWK